MSIADTTVEVQLADLLQLFKEVEPCSGNDDTLPVLMGIRLELGGNEIRAVCTDRYTLGMSRLVVRPHDGDEPVNLPERQHLLNRRDAAAIRRCFKPRRGMPTFLTLTFTEEGLTVSESGGFGFAGTPGLTMNCRWMDATFPAFATMISSSEETTPEPIGRMGFNGHFLARFAHAVRGNEPLAFHPTVHNKPARITIGDHFIGLIMPVRLPEPLEVWDWQKKPEPTATAKPAPRKRASRAKKAAA